jgi:transcriptional regulator with XRE-family HTH domain
MRLRNNIFAAAFDYLKREKGIKTQKRLAELMGVSEDTITRILKDRCEVTEDIITKLQTASGCIFNLQWLRGKDPIHMLAEDLNNGMVAQFLIPEDEERNTSIDHSSLVNAALAAKDETIAVLRDQITAKDTVIQAKDELIAALRQQIATLQQQLHATKDEELFKDFPFQKGIADKQDTDTTRV